MADKNKTGAAVSEQPEHDEATTAPGQSVNGEATVKVDLSSGSVGTEESVPGTAAKEKTTSPPTNLVSGLIREARPKQWVKNVLVMAVPFVAGRMLDPMVLLDAALAFVVFSMAASGIYFVNDAKDVEADRAHPTKCNRPIAAGVVPISLAWIVATVLLVGSVLFSTLISWQLAVVMAVYVAVQLGYCFGLKHQPVIDMCIVSSGFLLRAVAGGAAAVLPISPWFLMVTAFGSLFMVAGKRYAEIILAEKTGAKIRKSLESYSASYLRFVWATSAAIVIMTYSQWAYTNRDISSIWAMVSIVPFSVAMLRYAVDVDKGTAGEPEEVVLKDKFLILLGVALAGCMFMAFYL